MIQCAMDPTFLTNPHATAAALAALAPCDWEEASAQCG